MAVFWRFFGGFIKSLAVTGGFKISLAVTGGYSAVTGGYWRLLVPTPEKPPKTAISVTRRAVYF